MLLSIERGEAGLSTVEMIRARRLDVQAETPAPASAASIVRDSMETATFYAATVARVLPRAGFSPKRILPHEERSVFIVGSPRSGTSFVARSIGSLPGFVDLGEVTPLKAAIPELTKSALPEAGRGECARSARDGAAACARARAARRRADARVRIRPRRRR